MIVGVGTDVVEIARVAGAVGVDAARAPLELAVAIAPGDAEFLVAQVLPDGRRSAWRKISLDAQREEDADADAAAE